MNSQASSATLTGLTESQKAALLTLLADDDPAVYQLIRRKLLGYGDAAVVWLSQHRLSSDPVLRLRVSAIVRYVRGQQADNRFLAFCLNHGEDFDIEEGAWLLAQTQYPEINVLGYQAVLDSYANVLSEKIGGETSPEAVLRAMIEFLFVQQGFRGDELNYYNPENSYLNRVLDQRRGNPISLCLLCMLLGRRLHVPIVGVGMPGHFLARYQSMQGEIYIDAFHQGKLLSKADCVKYLKQNRIGFEDSLLSVANSRRMLQRMCANLHQIYSEKQLAEESERFQRYIVALAR